MIPLIYTSARNPLSRISDPGVSLARAPWDDETMRPDPRPETAPPRLSLIHI